MKWFRTRRGGIAWLACFALACQLFAAFGHVHLGKTGGSSGGGSIAFALADGTGAAAPSYPVPQKNPGVPADYCAICAVIKLAGTLLVPDAPALLVPVSFVHQLPWSPATAEPSGFEHFPFDARGPPQA